MLKYMSVGVDFKRNLFYTEGIIRGGSILKSTHNTLHKMPREILILIICALAAIIGSVDYITSFDISISLFYLAPILLAAWYIDRTAGVVLSITSAIIWFVTSATTIPSRGIPIWVLIWDAAILLGFFLVSAVLLTNLRHSLDREKKLARTDYLTGILNSRAFHEQANIEIARANRSQKPFTIAYFELVNFKEIFNRFGQAQAEKVLGFIGRELSRYLRVTDVIGRMGGEEFIILFSETDQQNATSVIARLYSMLTSEIHKKKWPILISMGVLTCNETAIELDRVLNEIDKMMYGARRIGKSQVTYRVMEKE
jgi:diguanylate cyclase (GGDEF)-like protein